MTDATLRILIVLGVFVLFATLETVAHKRARNLRRVERWPHILVLTVLGSAITRLIPIAGLASVSLYTADQGWGVFNVVALLPTWVAVVLAMIALDLAVWAQHVATHKVEPLWRLHRVHHTDVDIDVLTAFRFHPLEILVSFGWKTVVILALGAPVEAVLWFEIVLNACAQFNHSNLRLPVWLDRVLRVVIVTPDMHRVHHSVDRSESDTNYGFCLSIWDRLFGRYTHQFAAGEDAPVGQTYWRDAKEQSIVALLIQPFRRAPETSSAKDVLADK